MQATIVGEDERGIGVRVTDNNAVEHVISVGFDGEIQGHEQDGYPDDPAERSETNNEHVNQARRYARSYVYSQRGHDTVDHAENPAYVNAVREAIAGLSPDRFEEYFGPLHRQLRSHHDETLQRPVGIPAGARADDAVVYEQDVYLGLDLDDGAIADRAEKLAAERGLDLNDGLAADSPAELSAGDLDEWRELGDQLTDAAEPGDIELDIGAVSGIHVGYPDSRGQHQVQRAEDPLDREPDATIEVMPFDPGTLEEFREYLDHHLRCQVRDCFVGMGLVPPEAFRVVGFGKFIYARRYDQYDLYPPLHTHDGDQPLVFG